MVRLLQVLGVRGAASLAVLVGLSAAVSAARPSSVIRKLTLDESAPVVDLFDGMEAGQLHVKMSALSPHEANVFVKNVTDEPLTVAVPKAVIGVPVLPQIFGQAGNGFGNFGNNTNPGLIGGLNNQPGQTQSVGGQLMPFLNGQQNFPQGNGANNLNNPGQFNGLFSVPPEKTVQLKMRTVCLNYGLPDPHPGVKYELKRVESVTTDPVLSALLESYTSRVDRDAMQAAAWRQANGMSWRQVLNLPRPGVAGLAGGKLFSAATVKSAQSLVEQAEDAAKDRPQPEPASPPRKLASSPSSPR